MTTHIDHYDSDHLADLPPDLRRLDQSLGEVAARQRVPVGLTDRVYDASVGDLPRGLRLVGTMDGPARRAVPLHRTRWAQVAMAAGIALTFVVGAWFLAGPQPGVTEPRGVMVADSNGMQPEVTPAAYRPRALSPEAAQLLVASSGGDSLLVELFESRGGGFAHDESFWFDDHEL